MYNKYKPKKPVDDRDDYVKLLGKLRMHQRKYEEYVAKHGLPVDRGPSSTSRARHHYCYVDGFLIEVDHMPAGRG